MAKTKAKSPGGALGSSVTHLLHRSLQRALDYHGEAAGRGAVTQRQYTVLAAAAANDGLTQNDLVRATGIDRSTLADLVARMMAKGLLVRERSATDARANSVRLSDAGRSALNAGHAPATTADERLLAVLSPKKREGFIKALTALAEADHGEPAPRERKKTTPKATKPGKTAKASVGKNKPEKAAKKHKKGKKAKTVEFAV